jgi:hypothetical protein
MGEVMLPHITQPGDKAITTLRANAAAIQPSVKYHVQFADVDDRTIFAQA